MKQDQSKGINPRISPKETTRFTPEVYQSLENQFPIIRAPVTKDTSDIQAGYALGVEAVLRAVRAGFVIGG